MPTVAIDGHRFNYDEVGSGPPILLVHGTATFARSLSPVADRLASSHRVIMYDRRGFLETKAPLPEGNDYVRRSAADAAALLREIGAPRATVFGWGLGGIIALALAVDHPSAVSRILAFEAPLHARDHLGIRMTGSAAASLGLGKVGLHKRGAQRVLRRLFGYEDGGNAFDELDAKVRDQMLASSRLILTEMDLAGGGEQLTRGDLGTIRVPVSVLTGTRSAKFLRQAAERTRDLLPGATVVRLSGGDHGMPIRQPDRIASAIRETMS